MKNIMFATEYNSEIKSTNLFFHYCIVPSYFPTIVIPTSVQSCFYFIAAKTLSIKYKQEIT